MVSAAKPDPFTVFMAGPQPLVEEPTDEIPPPKMASTMGEYRRLGERTRVTTNEGARSGWGAYEEDL